MTAKLILTSSEDLEEAPPVAFQIGGAQKCGTNALYLGLYMYDDIALSVRKEVRLFANDQYFRGAPDREQVSKDYRRNFPTHGPGKIAGEATPEYMWYPAAVSRIRDYNPHTKWVICLRNPIARAYSQWRMMIRNGFEDRDFLTCLIDARERLAAGSAASRPADRGGLLSRGLYRRQIQHISSHFGDQKICLVFTGALRRHFRFSLDQVACFLRTGRPAGPILPEFFDQAAAMLDDDCVGILRDFYAAEITQLASQYGAQLTGWLDYPLSD